VLVIVPGVAFDKNLNRLGYGRGFYDRYLTAHSDLFSVGICYDCQMYDELPHDEGDVRLKLLISNEPG
jgi:5-formyltetrahydrofolate cyclo-ligase